MVNDDGAATSSRPPLDRSNTAPNKPKLSRRLTKRASEYLARASDPTAAPRVVIQAKIIRGDYHQDVERMAMAVVKLEKQRHIASKGAVRSEMRLSDVTCATWSPGDRQNALHQTFIAHLVDGVHLKLLHMRKRYDRPTVVYGNDSVTTVRWQVPRKPTPKQFEMGGTHTMHLVDVVSITPWTNALPPGFASKHKKLLQNPAESAPGSPSSSGFHGVLVVYTHATKRSKQKQLLLQANDSSDQSQMVDSLTKLVAAAKKKRDVAVAPPTVESEPLSTTCASPGESASCATANDRSDDHASTRTDHHKADQVIATVSQSATDGAAQCTVLHTPGDASSADRTSDPSNGVHSDGAANSSAQGSPLRPQPSASDSASSTPSIAPFLKGETTEPSGNITSRGDRRVKDEGSPQKEAVSSQAVGDCPLGNSSPEDKQTRHEQGAKADPASDEMTSSTRQPLPVERSAPDAHTPDPIGDIETQTSTVTSESAGGLSLPATTDEGSDVQMSANESTKVTSLPSTTPLSKPANTPTKPTTM